MPKRVRAQVATESVLGMVWVYGMANKIRAQAAC